jgi:hypothetical protein
VNRDSSVQAFVANVAILPDGRLGVSYFDFRSNTPSASALLTDFWLAQSTDGTTWTERRLAGTFDLAIAPNANGLFIGDYMGLSARGNGFVSLFAKANDGNVANRTDVHFDIVPADGAAGAKAATTYRASIARGPAPVDDVLAAKIDAAVKAAMQRRVPGWQSPAQPLRTVLPR